MSDPAYLKCPGKDAATALPQNFKCPDCQGDVEIWTDEKERPCPACGRRVSRMAGETKQSPTLCGGSYTRPSNLDAEKMDTLLHTAQSTGASAAVFIPAHDIRIDPDLAAMCHTPGCENYGLSKSCPPHVEGPRAMQSLLDTGCPILFFKIDVPTQVMYSEERKEIFRLLHETAAAVEKKACQMGFAESCAYAGGSCKKLFCSSHEDCRVLSNRGKCRHPGTARPSMSGFGFDVARLMDLAGWEMNWVTGHKDDSESKMTNVCGLVLIR